MITDLIKKDSRLKKLLRMQEKGVFKFNSVNSIKEIQQLHSEREGRKVTVADIMNKFQTKMLSSILQTQENRTRIVEIKMQAFKMHARLEKHTNLVKKHLRSTYSMQLNRMSGTAVDRDSTLESLLEKPLTQLADLKTVMSIADLAVNDLDQTGWSNKSIINVMEMDAGRKSAKF